MTINGNETIRFEGILIVKNLEKMGQPGNLIDGGAIVSQTICQTSAVTGSCPDGTFKDKEKDKDKWNIEVEGPSGIPCNWLSEGLQGTLCDTSETGTSANKKPFIIDYYTERIEYDEE